MDDLAIVPAGAGAPHPRPGAQRTRKVRPPHAEGGLYVVEGSIQFQGSATEQARGVCGPGDVVLAGSRTSHTFFNAGPGTARLLSIASGAHARFFDAVVEAEGSRTFSDLPPAEAFARVVEIGARTDTLFSPAPEPDGA